MERGRDGERRNSRSRRQRRTEGEPCPQAVARRPPVGVNCASSAESRLDAATPTGWRAPVRACGGNERGETGLSGPSFINRYVFPELSRFERKEERIEAWRVAAGGWFSVAVFVVCGFSPCLGTYPVRFLEPYLPPSLKGFGVPRVLLAVVAELIVLVPLVGCAYWITARKVRRSLRRSLVASGVPVCLHCGYDVRGQVEPRCPECGHEFDPKLRDLWEYLRSNRPDASTDPRELPTDR
jgi:hypothetical protein